MKIHRVAALLASLLLLAAGCGKSAEKVSTRGKVITPKQQKVIRLAIPPIDDPYVIFSHYHPLVKYASKKLGKKVKLVVPKTSSEFATRFNSGDFAFAFVDPVILTKIAYSAKVVVSATTLQDEIKRGLIVIPSESDIQSLEDLKGKTVCIIGKNGLETYISQMATIRNNGISALDINFVVTQELSEDAVIKDLLAGKCDAAFVSESHFRTLDDATISQLKVLSYTARVPNWAVVAYKDTPQELSDKLKEALLSLKADSKVLKPTKFSGFKEAERELYTTFLIGLNPEL